MNGKISHLPKPIQEQLNQRLEEDEEGKSILAWLNSLPEVKAVLKEKFGGAEITHRNLSEHKNRGFRDWQARQEALEFAASFQADDSALQGVLPEDLADRLSRWLTIRYAALTRGLASGEDIDKELRHLRNLSQVLIQFRRGEYNAKRLLLETKRLDMELSNTEEAREKDFWERAKRPDIQKKLYPNLNPDALRKTVVQMLDRELLGSPSIETQETADPAILI